MCARLRACRGWGAGKLMSLGVLLYVNTPEQKQNRRRKGKTREGSRPVVVVVTVVVVPCLQ